MSVFLCSIHSPGISCLPSSFPFPGSTPEYSRVHCLVLLRTNGAMTQKKGIYKVQSNLYQTRSDFQALPSQEKKRDPHTEYTPESTP